MSFRSFCIQHYFSNQKLIKSGDLIKKYHTIETYIEATKNILEAEEQNNNKNKYYNNLTKGKITALKELADRNEIIITKTDKGEAEVIIDVEDYVKEPEH